MCERRLALAVTQSIVAVGVASLGDGGGHVSAVLPTSFLMRSRLTWRRRCRTTAAWLGARASTCELARAMCVQVLSLDWSAMAAAVVAGGGAALILSAAFALCPLQ